MPNTLQENKAKYSNIRILLHHYEENGVSLLSGLLFYLSWAML